MAASVVVKNCTNTATITSRVSGLNDDNNGLFGTAAGIVSTSNQRKDGSLITIYNCKNTGVITGYSVGGIIADSFCNGYTVPGGTIEILYCVNEGDLTSTSSRENGGAGGIYGDMQGNSMLQNIIIKECKNTGTITVSNGETGNDFVGGSGYDPSASPSVWLNQKIYISIDGIVISAQKDAGGEYILNGTYVPSGYVNQDPNSGT